MEYVITLAGLAGDACTDVASSGMPSIDKDCILHPDSDRSAELYMFHWNLNSHGSMECHCIILFTVEEYHDDVSGDLANAPILVKA